MLFILNSFQYIVILINFLGLLYQAFNRLRELKPCSKNTKIRIKPEFFNPLSTMLIRITKGQNINDSLSRIS